jgi:hypothetical protein
MNVTAWGIVKPASIPNGQIIISVKRQKTATTPLHILFFARWAKRKRTADKRA